MSLRLPHVWVTGHTWVKWWAASGGPEARNVDRKNGQAARAAVDGFQADILASCTLSALAVARVRLAERLARALPLSSPDRDDLFKALLGRGPDDPGLPPVQGAPPAV